MKYLCLVYYAEKTLDTLDRGAYEALVNEGLAYDDELRDSGHLLATQTLPPVATATTVRIRGGRLSTWGGPFTGTAEQLRGFVLLDARDLNEAIQLAARIPPGRLGCVEIRPIEEVPRR